MMMMLTLYVYFCVYVLFSDYAISVSSGSYAWGGSSDNGTLTKYVSHSVLLFMNFCGI